MTKKIIIGISIVLITLLLIWSIIFTIDLVRCLNFKEPIFKLYSISDSLASLIGEHSTDYYCLGYSVHVYEKFNETEKVMMKFLNNELFEKENEDITSRTNIVATYNNPVIPKGFHKVETDTASWDIDGFDNVRGYNNGLVIADTEGNEFVWVPIEKYWVDDKYESEASKLELEIEETEDEIKQIYRFGGFYISRYEAGISEKVQERLNKNQFESNGVEEAPISKQGVKPWNDIPLKQAKINSKLMYNNEYVQSDLMTPKQYLRILRWFEETGNVINESNLRIRANFADSYFVFSGMYSTDYGVTYMEGSNVKKDRNIILATGISDKTKINNIYDLLGNLMEFTDGYVPDRGYYSVGGYYSEPANTGMPSLIGVKALDKIGFRVVLYQK